MKSLADPTGALTRGLAAIRMPVGIAGQHDVPPPGKWAGQAVECAAAHNHDRSHGEALEAPQVYGDVPGEPAVAADDAICRAGHNKGDRLTAHALVAAVIK